MNIKKSLATLFILTGLFSAAVNANDVSVGVDKNAVILNGYDAVAYFTQNKAVEGKTKFTATHNNAIYQFSSASNRDLFNADPSHYEPQFGGFCAYGAALGKKFDVNGKAFEIVDNKLYVNKNEDVYEVWVEDKAENIIEANKQWNGIQGISASQL